MKIAFYDTKPYDKVWFDKLAQEFNTEIRYFDFKLNAETACLSKDFDAVCIFVNDNADKETLEILYKNGVKLLALRCAGYNNVDFKTAYEKIHVVRVPEYSPAAVAEHAAALLLTLNRKTHRAYSRTRDNNFSINGFIGIDLAGKTAGVIGTGKIGRVFAGICKGFGMKVLAFDPYPVEGLDVEYVGLDELLRASDVISLHCPLTPETKHIINRENLKKMKSHAIIVNTSRGALIDTAALIEALKNQQIGGAGLDVYEEESEYFFEDLSDTIIKDDELSRLLTFPNVLLTSHQAFFTEEAMREIALTTMENVKAFEENLPLANEICYKCGDKCKKENQKEKTGRCF
ncbi:MAG: 2-hydroxyacid dehydrogenase [Oscillospiraceae bacterium]|nr:2-hydroxyacid dehydrogenase [Oscillospiraceae bacterium]